MLAPLQCQSQYYEADYTDSNLSHLVYLVVSAKLTPIPGFDRVLIDIQLQLIRHYLHYKARISKKELYSSINILM